MMWEELATVAVVLYKENEVATIIWYDIFNIPKGHHAVEKIR